MGLRLAEPERARVEQLAEREGIAPHALLLRAVRAYLASEASRQTADNDND